jgi:haloalkane dehalogenase
MFPSRNARTLRQSYPASEPIMEILRTPDNRFTALPGFPYAPRYIDDLPGFDGLRLHYTDAGPPDAQTVYLCLHGEPTWAYLFRRMLPTFLAAGARVVAPDVFGFGRSDKPVDETFYTFTRHRDTLLRFIERLDLKGITLVCQDWGGLLGLTLPMAMPDRFAGLFVMNTMFAAGDRPLTKGFIDWRAWVAKNPDLPVGKLMKRTCPHLTDAEIAAYDAPYPDIRYKAGVRRFPELVPESPNADGAALSRAARNWFQEQWRGKTFMAIGATDPVLGPPVMNDLAASIRGCPPPLVVPEAGHFVQEWGEDIARHAVRAFAH